MFTCGALAYMGFYGFRVFLGISLHLHNCMFKVWQDNFYSGQWPQISFHVAVGGL